MIKRSDEHTHAHGCMVVITCANRKEHHMAYERMVELVLRKKTNSINRVRELLPKWKKELLEFQCACYGGVISDLTEALDGEL